MKEFCERHWDAITFLIVFVTFAFVLHSQQQKIDRHGSEYARAICENINKARVQGNERAEVQREFLLHAEKARRASQAPEDIKTANKYRELRSRVHTVEFEDCNKDGRPDGPEQDGR